MDFISSYQRKAAYLNAQSSSSLLATLQSDIVSFLSEHAQARSLSPGLLRAITFDLSYLLERHRAWHQAPILAELMIDFLSSEYLLARQQATQLIAETFDILHSYTPKVLDWTDAQFEDEFLEHLLICSTLASDEQSLADDIGFGQNLIKLLNSAMVLDQAPATESHFQFAPELAGKIHAILGRIVEQQSSCPWILDLYRLKNLLQRDPYINKKHLGPPYLHRLFNILMSCNWQGQERENLAQSSLGEHIDSDLNTLRRCGLIYEESQARSRSALIRLSSKGLELSKSAFCLAACRTEHPSLRGLPAIYQTEIVAALLDEGSAESTQWLVNRASDLTPEALQALISALKMQQKDETLLKIFDKLLSNKAHAWIRAKICEALPIGSRLESSQLLLTTLAAEDPSPMVRSAARTAMKRQTRPEPSA